MARPWKRLIQWIRCAACSVNGLIVTFVLGALQAVLGGLLYLSGDRAGNVLHYVYGLLVLALIPVLWIYSDQNRVRRDVIIMTIAALLVVAAGVRALMTGPIAH